MTAFTENAIVLKCKPYGEKNRVVYLLTEKHGVIHAFANGARGIQSKNFAATSQFVYGSYVLVPSKDSYTVKESHAEASYADMHGDIEALALGQYFCELCMELAPEGTNAEGYLRLLRAALHYLNVGTRDKKLLKAAFEMRILCTAGFMPDLLMCRSCGTYEADTVIFYPAKGSLLCDECAKEKDPSSSGVALSPGALTALRHCALADLHKLFSFSLSENALLQLSVACERYLIARLERSFKTLEFYNQIKGN